MPTFARGMLIAVLGLVLGCKTVPAPVPVIGDFSELAGKWAGEYHGEESGRSGSILLELEAGRDTAFGDVLMLPRGYSVALKPSGPLEVGSTATAPQVITITFVRVNSGLVSGTLDPYVSPECGCVLVTTFTGQIRGDRITGSFITRTQAGALERGRWSAQRR